MFQNICSHKQATIVAAVVLALSHLPAPLVGHPYLAHQYPHARLFTLVINRARC